MMINAIHANAVSPLPTTSTADSSAQGLDSSFMTLLLAELKSQDPTQPMDATAMVGQMVNLNQLNELIQIRQILGGVSTSSAAHAASTLNPAANNKSILGA